MFVTREERRSLGGIISYWLPVTLAAALAFYFAGDVLFRSAMQAYFPSVLPIVAATAGLVFFASLFFLGRQGAWVKAAGASAVLAVLIAGQAWLGRAGFAMTGWPLAAAWAAGLSLASAIIDREGRGALGASLWRVAFARALSVPLTMVILSVFAVLISVPVLALLDLVPDLEMQLEAQQQSLPAVMIVTVTLLLGGLIAALVRRQLVLIGALRFAVLFAGRYLLPVSIVIGLMLLFNSLIGSAVAPSMRVAVSGFIVLCFILVYQAGETRRPALWVRIGTYLAALVTVLIIYPLLVGAVAEGTGIGSGVVLVMLGALVMVIGTVSDIALRQKPWMAVLAPVLTAMLVLIGFLPLVLRGLIALQAMA